MLMTRRMVASPVRNFALVGRLRFQLAVMWSVAVVLPGLYVYFGFVTADADPGIILNSVLASACASMIGLIAIRRVNDVPGVRSNALVLPSLAGAYGLTLALIFGARLGYSRPVLTGSFLLSVPVAFILTYFVEQLIKPQFFVVPGGDAPGLCEIDHAKWTMMEEPVVPDAPNAMLVADLRHNHDDEWERMLARAAISGRVVYHSKLLNESLTGKVTIEHLSENSFGSLLPNLVYRKLKRFIDVIACLVLAPVLFLPMGLIATLIKLDSEGPIIFRQERIGYRGEVFEMFKFRSMQPRAVALSDDAARDDAITRNDDDRITKIGRFLRRTRLDELPQIVNIFRGEMSWIGPRPEAVPLSKWYENEIPFYSYRHIIRPGISGWAQVHQGHVTDLDAINQKLAYDFYYVKYFSAWLDIIIALRTIPTMIGGFGAR